MQLTVSHNVSVTLIPTTKIYKNRKKNIQKIIEKTHGNPIKKKALIKQKKRRKKLTSNFE